MGGGAAPAPPATPPRLASHTDSDGPEPRRDGHTCTSCPGVLCLTTESPQVHPTGREPEGDPPRPERPQPGDPQPRGPVSSGTQEGGACR